MKRNKMTVMCASSGKTGPALRQQNTGWPRMALITRKNTIEYKFRGQKKAASAASYVYLISVFHCLRQICVIRAIRGQKKSCVSSFLFVLNFCIPLP